MTQTQTELASQAYLYSEDPEDRSAAGIALFGVGYAGGARISDHAAERNHVTPTGLWLASEHPEESSRAAMREAVALLDAVNISSRVVVDYRQGITESPDTGQRWRSPAAVGLAVAALTEALARFVAVGALLLALALPADAAVKRGTATRPAPPAGLESKSAQCAWIEGYAAAWSKAGKPDHGTWADWLTVTDADCDAWSERAEARAAKRKAAKVKADKR